MSWVALINSKAGRRPLGRDLVAQVLQEAEVDADLVEVPTAVEMRAAVVDVAESGRDLIVVGGDGTLGLVVDAVMAARRRPRIGMLPAGSGCDLARMFGISHDDLVGAARRFHRTDTYRIDVGRISGSWGDRHFVNVAQAGVGAAAAETAPRLSRRLGPVRYPMAFAGRLPRFPPATVTISGSRSMRGPALGVIVANGQFFAGGWNIAPKALLVDGAFDVQVIDAKKRQAPGLVPKLMAGTHLGLPHVWRRSMSQVFLEADVRWPVEADGDYLGTTPFEAMVVPGALELVV